MRKELEENLKEGLHVGWVTAAEAHSSWSLLWERVSNMCKGERVRKVRVPFMGKGCSLGCTLHPPL